MGSYLFYWLLGFSQGNNNKMNWFITGAPFKSQDTGLCYCLNTHLASGYPRNKMGGRQLNCQDCISDLVYLLASDHPQLNSKPPSGKFMFHGNLHTFYLLKLMHMLLSGSHSICVTPAAATRNVVAYISVEKGSLWWQQPQQQRF